MAETGKKAAEGAVPPVNNPAPDVARRDSETIDTPDESRNASLVVRTAWPHGSFTMEGVPVITETGTRLTKTQFDQAKKTAAASGVTLEEVK